MLRKACLISLIFLSFLAINGCTPGLVSVDHQSAKNNLTPLSHSSDSSTCQVVGLQGSAKDAALQQALADPQVQWLIAQMGGRGHHLDLEAAQAFQVGEVSLQVIIFFKPDGRLIWWTKENGETIAKVIISRKYKWEILEPYSDWQRLGLATTTELKEVLKNLHKDKEFQKVKKELEDKGYKLAEEKAQGLLNETKGEYFLWLRWQRQTNESSPSRAVPLLIDDGYSTGGGGTDIFVFYDPNTKTLILRIVPSDLIPFLECFTDYMVSDYGLIIAEVLILVAVFLDDCITVCEVCFAAPSIWNPGCWGCVGCVMAGAVAAGATAYAGYNCYHKCKPSQ